MSKEHKNKKQKRRVIHGQRRDNTCTITYNAWRNMKQRCYNPNAPNYEWYGAKGVCVCKRWLMSFVNFFVDMGPKPGPGYHLDRIDPRGDYTPLNVRWALPCEGLTRKDVEDYGF